jgi:hypothetical protein
MEDSPLSITASFTGVLTFVAAIAAFIYVRFQMLLNSEEEIIAILNSVEPCVEDTVKMAYLAPSSTES